MRRRSIAAVVMLLLVAVAGAVVVHELTRPVPPDPVAPIDLEAPNPAGAPTDDGDSTRRNRRGRDDGSGFRSAPTATPVPEARQVPDTAPPQIEVPTPPAGDSDDDEGGE